MVVVMAGVTQVFSSGTRMFSRGQEIADMQSVGQSALLKMTRELRETASSTVTTWPSTQDHVAGVGSAVAFRPPTLAPERTLVSYIPGNLIIYYHDRARRALVRRNCGPFVATDESDRWKEALLRDLLLKTDFVTQDVVAPHLEQLTITSDDQGSVAISMSFKLIISSWNEPRLVTVGTTVRVRNGM